MNCLILLMLKMSNDLQKKVDKIKKCLDLAASSNEHEAARALQMAQNLMKKYGLCDSDIAISGYGDECSKEAVQQKPKLYVTMLMNVLERGFGVRSIYTNRPNSKGVCKQYALFLGETHAASLAAYSFDVCLTAIKLARRGFAKTIHKNCKPKTREARLDAFSVGFVTSISNNLPSMPISPEKESSIKLYQDKKFGSLTTIGSRDTTKNMKGRSRDRLDSCINSGVSAGNNFSIYQPVNGEETTKIGSF